jgi:DNA ligase-associated metallophosphoesterase
MSSEGDVTITLRGEEVTLLPERAMLWISERALLIADPHWGKAATFRARGIPVPSGTTDEAIARLDNLVKRTHAREVIFLGDLLHAREGRSREMFASLAQWRTNNTDVELLLVRGNHDKRAGDPPGELAIQCEDAPYKRGPFILDHHPRASADGYVLAGHVHPGIRLYGQGRQSERLPCFVIGKDIAILPAFGDFTGLAIVELTETDAIYAIADTAVLKVKGRLTTMHR